MTDNEQHDTCRIVIGLKAASDIDTSVDAATTLAAAVKAEVVGLFIEEQAMIDLAGLPFARAMSIGATRPQRVTTEAMAQAFSRGALMCQRSLSARAQKAQVKWSFSAERGSLPEKIKTALAVGDYLVLSSEGHGFGSHPAIDELRAAASRARGVMIAAAPATRPRKGPVIAVDDGDAAGEVTVALAVRLAKVTAAPLMLFVIAASDGEADRIVRRAHELAGPDISITIHRFAPGAPRSIAAAFMHVTPSFVVADLEGEPFRNDDTALALFRAARAPVIMVRAGASEGAP